MSVEQSKFSQNVVQKGIMSLLVRQLRVLREEPPLIQLVGRRELCGRADVLVLRTVFAEPQDALLCGTLHVCCPAITAKCEGLSYYVGVVCIGQFRLMVSLFP